MKCVNKASCKTLKVKNRFKQTTLKKHNMLITVDYRYIHFQQKSENIITYSLPLSNTPASQILKRNKRDGNEKNFVTSTGPFIRQ